nr:ATP synthase F0 subunit 8 [Hemigyrus spinosus spinosus]
MPQMSPMSWITLFTLFLTLLIWLMLTNYSNPNPLPRLLLPPSDMMLLSPVFIWVW